MDLRLLRQFVAVSEERSLTVAAQRLGVSQPALSKGLKELEHELGTTLFVRSSRGTAMTEEGRVLYDRAIEILDMVDRAAGEVRSMAQESGCDVNIGLGESPDIDWISQAFNSVLERLPDTRLHLFTDNVEGIRSKLEMGFIDIGVVLGPVDDGMWEGFSTGREAYFGILMRDDDPLSGCSEIGRDELLGRRLITLRGTDRHKGLTEMFGDIFEKQSVASYNLINNASSMVRNGSGIAVTVDWLAERIDGEGLCFRPFRPRMITGSSIVWLKGRRLSSSASALIEELRRQSLV